ncbi:MAG: alpha/beta hydrolase family protein [Gemmatimonadales bacterium]
MKARPAPYFPDITVIARAIGDSAIREEFGSATDAVLSGRIVSLANEAPPLASSPRRFPVLLFSHGFGESSLTYAAQLADLASHGYVVFAVEHPHDAFAVRIADGRVIPFAAAAWNTALATPGGAVRYQLAQVPIRAADLRFALDRITMLAGAGSPFAGRLDLARVGIFGHSLGGVAAAAACREDTRCRACLNEDADDAGRPYDGGTAATPILQPFAFFATGHSIYVSPRTPQPNDSALARMKLTRVQYDSIVGLYQRNQDAAMASFPAGAWEIMAESPEFTHRTFIDLRTLQAEDDSGFTRQAAYLGVIRRYVRAFFDRTLNVAADSVLDHVGVVDSLLTVRRFPAR